MVNIYNNKTRQQKERVKLASCEIRVAGSVSGNLVIPEKVTAPFLCRSKSSLVQFHENTSSQEII